MKIILIILAVLLVLGFTAAWFLGSFTVGGTRQTLEEAMAWQSDHYDTSFYDTLEKTDYTVPGDEGYLLHVQLLRNPVPTDKYIILSHGYTDNRIGSLKYVKMYLDLGFNCIVYDLRGHGENESAVTTYGIREARDLMCLISDARDRYPELTELGLHGESLGAATTITSMQYHPEVDFSVADCGFSDIENVLREGYRNAHMPGILFDLADLGVRLRSGLSLRDMRPIDALDDCQIPILFIHGAEDSFILPKNSQDMAARTAGYSELHLIPGAGHAESILTAPETYRTLVSGFLSQISGKTE